MTTARNADEAVAELPPSAGYVYHLLQRDGPCCRQALLEELYLGERTLDRALATLRDGGYIQQTRDPQDTAQVVCRIDESTPDAPVDTVPTDGDASDASDAMTSPLWADTTDAADVPTCAICGNPVSKKFFRVWNVDGRLDGCRECRSRTQRFSGDPVINPDGEVREPFE